MSRLTEEEKREILLAAGSETLRSNMQFIRKSRLERQRLIGLPDYLEFLKFAQSISNCHRRNIRRIKGKNFKL